MVAIGPVDHSSPQLTTAQLYAACPRNRMPRTAVEESACYELWKRALRDRDEEALQYIIMLYQRLVAWLLKEWGHDEHHVMLVFIKIWYRYATPDFERHFPSLAAVVGLLRRCTATAYVDQVRAAARQEQLLADIYYLESDATESVEAQTDQNWQRNQLRQAVWQRLNDEVERLVFTLTYQQDCTPAEIARLRPDHFVSAEAVSTIKERILKRLKRDEQLRQLWVRS